MHADSLGLLCCVVVFCLVRRLTGERRRVVAVGQEESGAISRVVVNKGGSLTDGRTAHDWLYQGRPRPSFQDSFALHIQSNICFLSIHHCPRLTLISLTHPQHTPTYNGYSTDHQGRPAPPQGSLQARRSVSAARCPLGHYRLPAVCYHLLHSPWLTSVQTTSATR